MNSVAISIGMIKQIIIPFIEKTSLINPIAIHTIAVNNQYVFNNFLKKFDTFL